MKPLPPWVIYHIPHDSRHIPEDVRPQYILSDDELEAELDRMTDHHTCRLFLRRSDDPQTIYSSVSRLVVDVERFRDDQEESMSKIGMGAVYTSTSSLGQLRRLLRLDEREDLLRRFYDLHHANLEGRVAAARATYGKCLVIDCHSYPSAPLPYERGAELPLERPEICIGTDPFHTPEDLSLNLLAAFQAEDFDARLNTPFKGALVPSSFYQKDPNVLAVMIEVRRDIYMEERTGRLRGDFEAVACRIHSALTKALASVT